jgi:uracil-DNA glycosylase
MIDGDLQAGAPPDAPAEQPAADEEARAAKQRALEDQARLLDDCQRCALATLGRTQVVFGVGDPDADLLFVGEGPGFNEDKQGEPFVGQAGRLLTELLAAIGLRREDVYIANVVKCRPPGNRDPLPEEIEACRHHLLAQIATIRPRVICTLGRFATRLLAETEASMSSIRGKAKETEVAGVPVVIFPVFHPAAALYTPTNRTLLEEDFGKLHRLLGRGRSVLKEAHGVSENAAETETASPAHPADGRREDPADAGLAARPAASSPYPLEPQEQLPLF